MINEKLKIIINYQVVLSKDKNIKENCLIKNYKSIFYLIIKSICWRNKINHQSSIIRYRWERFSSGLQQAKWQTREQTGSEFTAHLRQDEAIPSALTSAPPRFSPVCLFFPSEPSFLLRAPIINQPRWMPGAHRRRRFLLPGGGTRQNRKCPDMSFRRGQFATRNWMIDSDNRPGAVPIQQSTTRIRGRRRHRYIENESPGHFAISTIRYRHYRHRRCAPNRSGKGRKRAYGRRWLL